jgi:hypothetical protein
MYAAKLGGHLIEIGTKIEMPQITDFAFKVVDIREASFKVVWLTGKATGNADTIPYSLFASIGHEVELIDVSDNIIEPNSAWLRMRMTNDS